MGLPDLFYPPDGADGWREFWFNHFQDHLEIVQAIQKKAGIPLTVYIITPWNDQDAESILESHQQYHNDMDQVLGIAGNDLSSVDFKKANELKSWVYLNYQEHMSAHSILDI